MSKRICPVCESEFESTKTGSVFCVKLRQLWTFHALADTCTAHWGGIWETTELRDQGTDKERWTIRRVMVTANGQALGEQRHDLPTWFLLENADCQKLVIIHTHP